MPQLESQIQSKIIKYLEGRGCYVVNCVQTGKAGTPDLIACACDGSFLAVEVKRPGQKPRPL